MPEHLDVTNITLHDLQRVHPDFLRRKKGWEGIQEIRTNEIDKKAHLPQTRFEPDQDYEDRVRMTRFVSEAPSARNRALGALFDTEPNREDLPDESKEWIQKVDKRGRSLDHWLETRAVEVMFDFGVSFNLVDRPKRPEDVVAPISRLQEMEAGLETRPFLVCYNPLQVPRWQVDANGKLLWIMIIEDGWGIPTAENGDKPTFGSLGPIRTYRLFDQVNFHVFKTRPKKVDALEFDAIKWKPNGDVDATEDSEVVFSTVSGVHGSPGDVPVMPFVAEPDGDILGQSLVARAVEMDWKRLQLESDHGWNIHVHSHPQLVITSQDKPSEVGVGASKFIHLKPGRDEAGRESAEYLAAPTEVFDSSRREIQRALTDTYRHVGTDPLGVIDGEVTSVGAASGVARAYSFQTSEGRHVARLRDRVQDGENGIHRISGKFLGVKETVENPVGWSHNVTPGSSLEQLEEIQLAKQILSKSPKALEIADKRAVNLALPELPVEDADTINKQLEDADRSAPKPPTDPFADRNGDTVPAEEGVSA